MLSDILATIIAFISVILLLSIVVTSLVQMSQAFLRLRGRNLMKGLAALLVNFREDGGNGEGPTSATLKKAKIDATKILNAPNVALTDRVKKPDSLFRYWLTGPNVSWIDPEELKDALSHANVDIGNKTAEELAEQFKKSEMHMKKRFLRVTRGWSVAWAIFIAFVFQLSAPALYNELASDSERRDLIVAGAEDLLAYHAEAVTRLDFNLVAPEALEKLAERHENHRMAIEEATGVGTTRAFVLEELELALEDVPEKDALVDEYGQLISEIAKEKREQTGENLQYAVSQLGQYDIKVWPRDWDYYIRENQDSWVASIRWDSVIGVLITGILLSFGGSFWFKQLRNVLSLRDTLAGKQKKTD